MSQGQQYLDFELEINSGSGGELTVIVDSPAGRARAPMTFPFRELELQNYLKDLQIALLRARGFRRRIPSAEERTVETFGTALFNAVMTGPVASLYYASHREAVHAGKGLRLKLRILPPHLAALPWEFLFDPINNEYVCLSSHTPLVRYPEVALPAQPLAVTPPLRILGMVASPEGLDPLDVALERQRMETALVPVQKKGLVKLHWLEGQTWRDLQRALRRETWHVFHFIGHGGFDNDRDEGLLMLADEQGQKSRIYATALARLLANHRSLKLVLLNACEGARESERDVFSSTASTLIRRGIPAVVAMQYEISDRAAIEFGRTFYEALTDELPVDEAVTEARVAVSLAFPQGLEWGTPVLYMRVPGGRVFALHERAQPLPTLDPSAQAPDSRGQSMRGQDTSPHEVKRSEAGRDGTPAPAQSLPATFRLQHPIELDLILVPASEFLMGSDKEKDPDVYDDELPQHKVYLPDFYMARTPVTNAQYKVFVEATGHEVPEHWKDGRIPEGKKDHPVVWVSWHDARAFCDWLSRKSGREVRLPTEAEWEKAARGTDGRIYPWGNQPPDETLCNFNRNVSDTTPVGAYPKGASPCGCLDMAGNVWEWTSALPQDYPYRVDDGREDPEAKGRRVVRGGSWRSGGGGVRCAARDRNNLGRYNAVGFRVVSPGF